MPYTCVCNKEEEEEPEFSLVSGSFLPTRHHMADGRCGLYTCQLKVVTVFKHAGYEGERRMEGERTLAVRSSMDVALPYSAGMVCCYD